MKKKVDDLKQAYRKLKDAQGRIKEAYEDMLLRLAITAEYKNPGIGGHIRRVSDYSTAIARSMELAADEVAVIRYASMMHDMGKMAVREGILDKDTPLTAEERKEIERHALIGGRIFEGSVFPLVKAASEIALSHHEKYDGTGYPRGLKGSDIPLYGRIVAVADHFDALSSKRSYKNPLAFEDAIREIEAGAGTFFDPQVVIAFVKIRATLKKIISANAIIDSFVRARGKKSERANFSQNRRLLSLLKEDTE
jgi:putative two-component system response regulator